MPIRKSYNLLLQPDSYKHSHRRLMRPGITSQTFYCGTRWSKIGDVEVVPLGIGRWLEEMSAMSITSRDVDDMFKNVRAHMGDVFFESDFSMLWNYYSVNGCLPITIEALEEGKPVPVGAPIAQITATDGFEWLPGTLETDFLRALWYPTTVATMSREMKKKIARRLLKTKGDLVGLEFMLHDFGARGATSRESARIAGEAHAVNFMGSDTLSLIEERPEEYKMHTGENMPVFSIPATEHSIITAYGEDGETAAHQRLIDQFLADEKIVASVGDSYDVDRYAFDIVGGVLRDKIIMSGGRYVGRPDSGDPRDEPVRMAEHFGRKFGHTVNKNGYKTLPAHIGVIQGDGIKFNTFDDVLDSIVESGWCVSNFAFGMGGGLHQSVDRDTLGFSMKLNEFVVDGVVTHAQKRPKGDPSKKSIAGRVEGMPLVYTPAKGSVKRRTTLAELRENAKLDQEKL